MFCINCGTELPDGSRFCSSCGEKNEKSELSFVEPQRRERHGFTSFWLIFSLIGYVFSGFFIAFEHEILSRYWLDSIKSGVLYYPLFAVRLRIPMKIGMYWDQLILFSVVANIIGIAGLVLLLRWKKIGFPLIVISYIIGFVFASIFGMIVGSFFGSIIGIAIIYGILHLRKNGKTAWEQLK
jgi:predicted nucleic acid-binding Zn ribbon protein